MASYAQHVTLLGELRKREMHVKGLEALHNAGSHNFPPNTLTHIANMHQPLGEAGLILSKEFERISPQDRKRVRALLSKVDERTNQFGHFAEYHAQIKGLQNKFVDLVKKVDTIVPRGDTRRKRVLEQLGTVQGILTVGLEQRLPLSRLGTAHRNAGRIDAILEEMRARK